MATIQLDAATLEEDLRLGRAFFLAGLTVICCDYLLTLDLEVTHIWSAPWKRSSAWFVLVRYFALIGNLALIPYFFGNFDEEKYGPCRPVYKTSLIKVEFFVEVTCALRVCAIYGFNRRVFGLLGIAGIVTITLSVWSTVPMESNFTVGIELPSCYVITVKAQAIRMATAWEALLVGDIIVMGLTLWRAYTLNRTIRLGTGSLLGVLVRDGVAYFGFVLLFPDQAMTPYLVDLRPQNDLLANGDSLRATTVPFIDMHLQFAPIGRDHLGRVDSVHV
ncbi:hypothetical protein B0H13DRAFT_2310374 [Mycena leptocephala]|nr:hypothetical protein B0H13DRAFT_2310374 [Mycena leptocephala]